MVLNFEDVSKNKKIMLIIWTETEQAITQMRALYSKSLPKVKVDQPLPP